jgi:molybdenum cofactor guanylyltransferase
METPQGILGVILAGGKSERMGGGDKCLNPLGGRPMLARVIERLKPQVGGIIISANGDLSRFAQFGLPVVADSIAGFPGPLAGVQAGLKWAAADRPGVDSIVTVAADTPFFPADLVRRFVSAAKGPQVLLVARSEGGVHPVIGLWPVGLGPALKQGLESGLRKVRSWVELQGAQEVFFPPVEIGGRLIDPFFNINRPEDLAEANALLEEESR